MSGDSSQALGIASMEMGLASQAPVLASWVELPEVLDVPGVLDGGPFLRVQARGARPGVMGDPKRALPLGRELVQPFDTFPTYL